MTMKETASRSRPGRDTDDWSLRPRGTGPAIFLSPDRSVLRPRVGPKYRRGDVSGSGYGVGETWGHGEDISPSFLDRRRRDSGREGR